MDKKRKKEMELSDEILELVDNRDKYTRSNLQGRATAIIKKAMRE